MITHLFCWGVFLITCCTLMQQIILTRIFSVIMWYHLSLVSISMTMLGLTLGALVVHFRPQWFDPKDNRAQWACGLNAQICGLSTFLGLFYCLNVPVVISSQFSDVAGFIFWNFMASLPFIFSGIVVCAALTKFPRWVSKIYFYDLLGASIACLFAVWLVNTIDAPSAILFCGVFAQLASLFFFPDRKSRKIVLGLTVLGIGLAFGNTHFHYLRVKYSFDRKINPSFNRHEYWNIFSYVLVSHPREGRFFWGKGKQPDPSANEKNHYQLISMDIRANTPLTQFDGKSWEKLEWLKWDVTSLVHNIRQEGPVLVVGSGGGRDVLTALLSTKGQRKVTGVDINPYMVQILTETEKQYSGNLADLPQVQFFVDEARSWISYFECFSLV